MAEMRDARAEELPAIVALLADDATARTREDASLPLDPGYEAAFAAIARNPDQRLIVAVADGQVVGTMQLSFLPSLSYRGGWRMQIEAVRIARDRRGGGLGSAMIGWAIAEARARGCRLVQLSSSDERVRAHAFYERLGFIGRHRGFKLQLSAQPTRR